jgi:hypothetical protein
MYNVCTVVDERYRSNLLGYEHYFNAFQDISILHERALIKDLRSFYAGREKKN